MHIIQVSYYPKKGAKSLEVQNHITHHPAGARFRWFQDRTALAAVVHNPAFPDRRDVPGRLFGWLSLCIDSRNPPNKTAALFMVTKSMVLREQICVSKMVGAQQRQPGCWTADLIPNLLPVPWQLSNAYSLNPL